MHFSLLRRLCDSLKVGFKSCKDLCAVDVVGYEYAPCGGAETMSEHCRCEFTTGVALTPIRLVRLDLCP